MARTVDKARHAELANKALEAIRKRGVHGVTMRDIAEDLGIKRSTLYWYFKGLGDVFDVVLTDLLERQTAFVMQRLDGVDHPIVLLDAWMRAMLDFYADDPQLIQVLAQLWAAGRSDSTDGVVKAALDEFLPLRDMAVHAIEMGIDAGQVAPCDAAGLVDLCASLVDGVLIHQVSRNVQTAPMLSVFQRQVLQPLHLGDWTPEPIGACPPPSALFAQAVTRPSGAGIEAGDVVLDDEVAPQQVVRPRGNWLELD